jgi:transcriptional regulator with PAS, ATPase and Fis domain
MTEIITIDRKMREILALTETVAQSKATVLIQGESGTGKELIAKRIHEQSSRAKKPFIAINCAAIPENLLESELFGFEKGAFTGATQTKLGKFELAQGGTLLLDEISEMDIKLQVKLLRALQECQIDRLGGSHPIAIDVRILSATNKNLSSLVRLGRFREDLFYRLNVVNITLPPLRDRTADIALLANHFIKKYSPQKEVSLSPDVLEKLKNYSWQGNIRELENVIERSLITCNLDTIEMIDLSLNTIESLPSTPLAANTVVSTVDNVVSNTWKPGTTLDDVERGVIIDALSFHSGNRTHTAKALGISIRTLRNKIADYRKLGIHL